MNPETAIDAELVRRFVASSDMSAFATIMERYQGKVYALVLGLLRNRADAEEIASDTFIRAYRGLQHFRGESSLKTWLYRVAVNLARNRYWYYVRRRRDVTLSLDCPMGEEGSVTLIDQIPSEAEGPADELETMELADLIGRAMPHLDVKHREILTLRVELHHDYREMSAILGIDIGTVKSRLVRARAALRAKVGHEVT